MNSSRIIGCICILLICTVFLFACGNDGEKPYSTTASIDKEILKPFLRSKSYDSLEEARAIDKTRLDALILGLIAYNLIVDYQNTGNFGYLVTAREYLDYLMTSYPMTYSNDNLFTWKYDFSWGDLAPGWWSCMDSAINALAFKAGSEIFGDPAYEIMYKKALNGLLSSVQGGGSALSLGPDSFWMSEYAWEGLTQNNEYYVFNGYAFSLLALRIVASVTEDQHYATMYDYALNSYKNMHAQFYSADGKWTWYMLNPKDIEPMHYAIFDGILIESLYKISNDIFYSDELSRRRGIFRNEYPFYIDDNNEFMFSLLGPPWPYSIDTYVIKIDFMDDHKIIGQKISYRGDQFDISPKERFFLTGSIPPRASSAVVWSEYKGQAFKVYEVNIPLDQQVAPKHPASVSYHLSCAYDAVCQDANTLKIDPSRVDVIGQDSYTNTQGRIIMSLDEPISRSSNKYFGININPEQNVNSLEVLLFDDQGNHVSQYYIPLKGGSKNLLLFSWLGFKDIDTLTNLIKEIQITIHTSNENPYIIKINDILRFEDVRSVKEYFDSNEFYFPEKEKAI